MHACSSAQHVLHAPTKCSLAADPIRGLVVVLWQEEYRPADRARMDRTEVSGQAQAGVRRT